MLSCLESLHFLTARWKLFGVHFEAILAQTSLKSMIVQKLQHSCEWRQILIVHTCTLKVVERWLVVALLSYVLILYKAKTVIEIKIRNINPILQHL